MSLVLIFHWAPGLFGSWTLVGLPPTRPGSKPKKVGSSLVPLPIAKSTYAEKYYRVGGRI
jgi:hypothetical protein